MENWIESLSIHFNVISKNPAFRGTTYNANNKYLELTKLNVNYIKDIYTGALIVDYIDGMLLKDFLIECGLPRFYIEFDAKFINTYYIRFYKVFFEGIIHTELVNKEDRPFLSTKNISKFDIEIIKTCLKRNNTLHFSKRVFLVKNKIICKSLIK